MFQITADISALTAEQRNAVAAFIIDFPSSTNNHEAQVTDNAESVIFTGLVAHSEEDEELSPESAFAIPTGPVLVPFPTAAATSIAPVVAALPALPTNGAVALDKNGIPWDERIHASSRVKVANGSWRTKRGVDEALVAQVEAELKALMDIAAVPPPPPAPVAETPAAAGATVPAPPTILGHGAAPAAAVADRNAFVKLLSKATTLIQTNKLTQDELSAAVVTCGVPSLPLLAHRLDLVPQVEATIDAMTAGR